MKRIAVIGLSSFGLHLARTLNELGCEVLAVDQDEAAVGRVADEVSKAVIADATDKEVLQELGVIESDAVVLSLGEHLEASVITAMHLKELGAKHVVAKALSEDHVRVLKLLGVDDVVFPERDSGVRLAYTLGHASIVRYMDLGSDFAVAEIVPPAGLLGKTLAELDFRARYRCQVLALKTSAPGGITRLPDAGTRLSDEHVMVVMGKRGDLDALIKSA